MDRNFESYVPVDIFKKYMEQYILQKLKDTLATDIAGMVDQTIKQHAVFDIYGAYSPRSYKRRGLLSSGGNYRHDLNGFSLTVTDETPGNTPSGYGHTPSGTELSEIIETGAQGNGGGLWRNAFARPYIENAQREVDAKVLDILQSKFS